MGSVGIGSILKAPRTQGNHGIAWCDRQDIGYLIGLGIKKSAGKLCFVQMLSITL